MSVTLRLTVPDLDKQIETGGVFSMYCFLRPLILNPSIDRQHIGASFIIRTCIDGSETNRMYKETRQWGADNTISLNGTHRDESIVVSLDSYPKMPVHVDFFRIDMFCAY